jgi:hypothetical protein
MICGYNSGDIPELPPIPPKFIPAIAAKPPKLPPTLLSFVCGTKVVEAVYTFGVSKAIITPTPIKMSVILMTFLRPPHIILVS